MAAGDTTVGIGPTARSPERAASRSDPGPTGASLPGPLRSDDQQPAPWLASATHGAPAYPLLNHPGILNPSPSPGVGMRWTVMARPCTTSGHSCFTRGSVAHRPIRRRPELVADGSDNIGDSPTRAHTNLRARE